MNARYTYDMCGRVNNHLSKLHAWSKMFGNWPDVKQGYNLTPTASLAVFTEGVDKLLDGKAMRWGMIPKWSSTFNSKYNTFNARLESVDEKPTFRSAWKKQQKCLIPIAGYYEWQSSTTGESKQPFYITDRNIGGLVMAGLYEGWGEEPETLSSCTIITKPAIPELAKLHPRMPLLLTVDSAQRWLSSSVAEDKELLTDCDPPEVVYWPVSREVGNTRNTSSQACKAIDL